MIPGSNFNSNFTHYELSDPIVIQNKNNFPIWDMYQLRMENENKTSFKNLTLFTEHKGIDMENTPKEVQKHFFIDRLFGPNGLMEKEQRPDQIFLGKLEYDHGVYKPTRFYKVPYSDLSAQEYFDQNINTIYSNIQSFLNDYNKKVLEQNGRAKMIPILDQYGITWNEYKALRKYMSSEYLVPTTLFHEVDFNRMQTFGFTNLFQTSEFWFDPKNVKDTFESIYSMMCKFTLKEKKSKKLYRVSSALYKKEMEQSGVTSSFLSFSANNFCTAFTNREHPLFLKGTLKAGVPHLDTNALQCSIDGEDEILIPPFQNILYTQSHNSDYDYNVEISKPRISSLTSSEINEMQNLEGMVLNTDIIRRFYENWYHSITTLQSLDPMIVKQFQDWQKLFKKYMHLRFKKIEVEVLLNQSSKKQKISFSSLSKVTKNVDFHQAKEILEEFTHRVLDKGKKR